MRGACACCNVAGSNRGSSHARRKCSLHPVGPSLFKLRGAGDKMHACSYLSLPQSTRTFGGRFGQLDRKLAAGRLM